MSWASRHSFSGGAPLRIQANTSASSAYTPNLTWPGRAGQGYLSVASRVARVRFSPAPGTFASSRVSSRRLCALPSKPPQPAANVASADSPLCPNGG